MTVLKLTNHKLKTVRIAMSKEYAWIKLEPPSSFNEVRSLVIELLTGKSFTRLFFKLITYFNWVQTQVF